MRESELQRKVSLRMEAAGWMVVKIIQCSKNGWPDLQCHRNGQTIFIEVKAPGKKPRPLQDYRLTKLREMGFKALVIDNITQLTEI